MMLFREGFLRQGELLKCVQKYTLGIGNGYILGIFPRRDLKHTILSDIFHVFVQGLCYDDPYRLYDALHTLRHDIDATIVNVLKDKFFAIYFLLSHLHVHQLQPVLVGPQPLTPTRKRKGDDLLGDASSAAKHIRH